MEHELKKLEDELSEVRSRLDRARRRAGAKGGVTDYTLKSLDGRDVRLSELFGDKQDLIVVHNMGRKCAYCTLWADGFAGFAAHLSDRAGFVLCSADEPAVAKEFATSRKWPFRVLSGHGSPFARDMGYQPAPDQPMPGASTFHRAADGSIERVSTAPFGPGDSFCAIWPFFDMLKDGPGSWVPKYAY